MIKSGSSLEYEFLSQRRFINDFRYQREEIILLGNVERILEVIPPVDDLKLCFS
jgi:hypothetical protein